MLIRRPTNIIIFGTQAQIINHETQKLFVKIHTLSYIIKVFSSTDAQLDSLKNKFKFALNLTL
jgi:hypothetical protein